MEVSISSDNAIAFKFGIAPDIQITGLTHFEPADIAAVVLVIHITVFNHCYPFLGSSDFLGSASLLTRRFF